VDLAGGPGHGFMMSLDGRIFEWDFDTDERLVVDPLQIRLALVSATSIPELMRLVPARPAEAVDCETCKGTGRRTVGPIDWLCDACGAVGWRALAG
jgi:hypothetical protein